jgi:hypothetical protein
MSPFQSLSEYETYVYTLQQRYPVIQRSTLVIGRRGQGVAILSGELHIQTGYRLSLYEILTWDGGTLNIQRYSYEAWRANEKLYWYDPQPHPHEPKLASTHPHHKHVPPDIKHNRIPAPGLHFDAPNLAFLIEEIEAIAAAETEPDNGKA